MTTKYIETGDTIQIDPGATYTKGRVYFFNGIPAVALDSYVSGDDDAVFATQGVFDLDLNASDTATRGKVAYWDSGANEVVDTPVNTDCKPCGLFWETTSDASAHVKLASLQGQTIVLEHAFADGATLDLSGYAGPFDLILTVDTQGGAVEVDLPSVADMQGRRITVIRAGTGVNAITLDQNGSETINASASADASLDAQHDVLTLQGSSPTNWHIVSSIVA